MMPFSRISPMFRPGWFPAANSLLMDPAFVSPDINTALSSNTTNIYTYQYINMNTKFNNSLPQGDATYINCMQQFSIEAVVYAASSSGYVIVGVGGQYGTAPVSYTSLVPNAGYAIATASYVSGGYTQLWSNGAYVYSISGYMAGYGPMNWNFSSSNV